MDILLPKRMDGTTPGILKDVHQITVIGANGAGKTRFSREILKECGSKAFKLAALKAIFPETSKNELVGSIDMLYDEAATSSHFMRSDVSSEFDKLIFLLLHDEFLDLLKYKTAVQLQNEPCQLPTTKLDKVVKMWEEVFPKNKILRESGKLLFECEGDDEPYSSLRLSDGEKSVLYYLGAVMYAMPEAVIFVEDPGAFLHHSIMQTLWNVIEEIRPDCTFIYNTHDIEFASSRIDNKCIWVKNFDSPNASWDYDILDKADGFSDQLYIDLLGSRKPVLFIEGDETHSIDSKLYPLIFPEYTIKPLGSCDKVIESTRTFNDLNSFHHLDSHGIVDRDRRDEKEVEYLRGKKIFVPNVAEIENILMIEGVIRAMAHKRGKNPDYVFDKVKNAVLNIFKTQLKQQALQHVRHRVKKNVEYRIDRRFQNINALEDHMLDLVREINPRGMYERFCREFQDYEQTGDYAQVLRVFNEKSILPDSNLAQLCGLNNADEYIRALLNTLKEGAEDAQTIRNEVKKCFGIQDEVKEI